MLSFALISLVASQTPVLAPALLSSWDSFKTNATQISDKDCSGEIAASFNDAASVLTTFGYSENFISACEKIHVVAGDIPEAATFRDSWKTYIGQLKGSLPAATSASASTSSDASAPSAAASSTDAATNGEDEGYDYGAGAIISSAESLTMASGMLLLVIASL